MADTKGPKDAWAETANSLNAIVQQIDDNELTSTSEGRAFLAGAAAGFRRAAAEVEAGAD